MSKNEEGPFAAGAYVQIDDDDAVTDGAENEGNGIRQRFQELVKRAVGRQRKLPKSISSLRFYHIWDKEDENFGPPRQWLERVLGSLEGLGIELVRALPKKEGGSLGEECMKWNKPNVEKLIDHFHRRVIIASDTNGKTLIQEAVIKERFDCAKMLFDYAAEKKIVVRLEWDGDDVLGHSLKVLYSREAVRFVMERMLDRCASPKETATLFSKHLYHLINFFPDVFERFAMDERFSFEYGRFKVPKSIFDETTEKPIGMTIDQPPSHWKATDEKQIKEFWTENCPELKSKIDAVKEEELITAVSKFACIEDAVFTNSSGSIADLVNAKCTVDVFECETIRTNVQWKWHNYLRKRFVFSNWMYLLSVVSFFLFAIFYGDITHCDDDSGSETDSQTGSSAGNSRERELLLARVSICCSLGFLVFPLVTQPTSYVWLFLGGLETLLYLVVYSFLADKHTAFSAGVVSVHCLIIIFKSFRCLRPFRWFGPFVTMVHYVLKDIVPFMFLGAVVVANFGIGFFVLMGRSYQHHDKASESSVANTTTEVTEVDEMIGENNECNATNTTTETEVHEMLDMYKQNFKSPGRTFEYLLYALLGQFDPTVFHLSANSQFTAWIEVFFCLYLLLAAIVLLSLLISVLGNTFDRVVLHEEGEFIKNRARCNVCFERLSLFFKRLRWKMNACFKCSGQSAPEKFRYHGGHLVEVKKMAIFHYLVPAEPGIIQDSAAWHGRIHAVVQRTRTELQQAEQNAAADRESFKSEIKEDLRNVQSGMHEFQTNFSSSMNESMHRCVAGIEHLASQLTAMEGKLEALSKRLDQTQPSVSHA